jgi:hypothetical protein
MSEQALHPEMVQLDFTLDEKAEPGRLLGPLVALLLEAAEREGVEATDRD